MEAQSPGGGIRIQSIIAEQFVYLKKLYPLLSINYHDTGAATITGTLKMDAQFNGIRLFDDYLVRIEIPSNYPMQLPVAFETSGMVPKEFMHFLNNDALCLGVANDLWNKFLTCPTILFYVNEFVVSYFYSVSFFKKYGCFPFGERSHGTQGIIEYYREKFKVENVNQIIDLLMVIYKGNYRGHLPCACGSGIATRKCHGLVLLEAIKSARKDLFIQDLYCIVKLENERKK